MNGLTKILNQKEILYKLIKCQYSSSTDLKEVFASKIPKAVEQVKEFRKTQGTKVVGDVTVNMIYNGMRGIKALICETSVLDPNEGIRFRGYSIPECEEKLPKAKGATQPIPEGIFWLLLTGDIPNQAQVDAVSKEWACRSALPDYCYDFMEKIPKDVHPMSQFSAVISILNSESTFAKAYASGVKKTQYWEYVYEDSMNLVAKLSVIAGSIYAKCFKNSNRPLCDVDENVDYSLNFAKMMGYDNKDFIDFLRLYLVIHSDHEGGNVSAHTTHLVGSALSDPYLSFAAGMNGLAGPLHGRANQEVLEWLQKVQKEVGENVTEEKLKEFTWKTLKSGQVVPGYGHAVLRKTDPRFVCQAKFANKYIKDDSLVALCGLVFKVVPPILKELGKVQNPWPNVDAHSGVLLYHYGMKEMQFYTVLFGVSRALGVLPSLIWDRAYGLPIERPKSFSTEALIKLVNNPPK
ncbi:unnamed protein product [Brassicogethes aeneus]|uniref:Citrate synthase n=1 Tax=Brassicogethes aeneus TaxID=1431903 RepID=A0A9P0F8V2_BRAAE|nr:unnamed protein product [Brassicogethes aeneus]